MKETGQILKDRRESQDISLAEVSISTKITSRMLQAIESGDMDHLPARTFLRGFVKSYATFLKMDVDEVLRAFNEEMAILDSPPGPQEVKPSPAGQPVESVSEPIKPKEEPKASNQPLIPEGMSNTKKLGLAGGLLSLILLIAFVYRMVNKYETEARVEPPPQLSKIETSTTDGEQKAPAEIATTEPKAKEISSNKTEAAAVTPTPEKSEEKKEAGAVSDNKKPEETKVSEQTPLASEKKAPEKTSSEKSDAVAVASKPQAETQPEAKTEPNPNDSAATAEAKPATKPKATQELIIEALDKVEIRFRVNQGESKTVTLQPDQVHTIKAAGAIALEMSDGGAVNLIHNGKDVGVPGDLGKPKKIQLP